MRKRTDRLRSIIRKKNDVIIISVDQKKEQQDSSKLKKEEWRSKKSQSVVLGILKKNKALSKRFVEVWREREIKNKEGFEMKNHMKRNFVLKYKK